MGDRPSEAAPPALVDAGLSPDWKRAWLAGGAGGILVLLVLWPTLLGLVVSWQDNHAYQYAWLVMPMVIYLLGWHHRQHSLAAHPAPDFTGVFVAVGAASCWSAAWLMNVDVGRQWALVLALQGVAMSTLGWRSYWRLFPTLALMFLMVPSADLLQPALRILTVKIIGWFAAVAEMPHSVDGFVVSIGVNDYVVIDECAGLSHFLLATFLGYCFGLMLYRSVLRIVALALFGAFLGILSNALRVSAIVLIDWVQGSQMALTAHSQFQWLALYLALGILFLVLGRLTVEPTPELTRAVERSSAAPVRQLAPVVAGLSVLVIAGAASWMAADTPQQPRIVAAGWLPPNIVGWELTSTPATWSVDAEQRTGSLTLSYRRDGQDLRVVIVETLAPGAKLQEAAIAPGAKNLWHHNKVQSHTSCVASDCATLLHTTWENATSEQQRHVYAAYGIGTFATNSKLALRAAQGWYRLTGGGRSARLIGFSLDAAADAIVIDELAAAFRLLQSALDAGNR